LRFADEFPANDSSLEKIATYFKCNNCRAAFLRALFCASGSVSDPKKSYTLEMRLQNAPRAEMVRTLAEECGLNPPSLTNRNGSVGLFYRNESGIEEFLTFCSANHSLFEFFNIHIEKDIRNAENRATNCVAKNILKSVEAISAQIEAIEALKANGMFDELSDELKATADLRLENQEATLSELASLHNPKISKSGLNHRLSKIIDEAKKRRLIK
jgi:DNA-binding protein WhiA